jgi:hypothetical protein
MSKFVKAIICFMTGKTNRKFFVVKVDSVGTSSESVSSIQFHRVSRTTNSEENIERDRTEQSRMTLGSIEELTVQGRVTECVSTLSGCTLEDLSSITDSTVESSLGTIKLNTINIFHDICELIALVVVRRWNVEVQADSPWVLWLVRSVVGRN